MTTQANEAPVFRAEAIEYHTAERAGEPLRLDSRFSRWTFRIILAAGLIAVLFSIVFDVSEYASGAAIIQIEGRRPLLTTFAGTVESVHVQPGQHVNKDQILVTMSAVQEEAELQRAAAEFQLNLASVLRDPSDSAARSQLSSLRPRKDVAARIAQARNIRAPNDGVITDVRVRPGQHLSATEVALGIAPLDAATTLVCLLPGQYRPMLKKGQNVRFSLDGYKFEYRNVPVESVGEEVVGPTEIRRYLGQELGDAVPVEGATVLVKTRLPTRTFSTGGQTYSYVEGLAGHADVKVRSEPIIVLLIPSLKALKPESRP